MAVWSFTELICAQVAVARGPVYEPPAEAIKYEYKPHSAYALLVVRRPSDGRYLVVLESSHTANCQGTCRWWIPAGKAAPGETMAEAAVASCLRDTNVKVTPKGIIRILLEPSDNASIRSVLYCEPDEVQPRKMKAVPSFHSAGAAWVTADEFAMDISGKECRSGDPKVLFPGVSNGSIPIEPFGNTWNALEALVAKLGRTPPSKELDEMRRGPLQEQWVAICKRYPLISFKEKDFMARSSKR